MIHIARRVKLIDISNGNTLQTLALLTYMRQQRLLHKTDQEILQTLPWTCHSQAIEMLENAEYYAVRTENPLEPLSANIWWCDVLRSEEIIPNTQKLCAPCIEKLLNQRVFEDCVEEPESRYSPHMLRVKYNSEEQDFQCVAVQEFLVQHSNGMWRSMYHFAEEIEELFDGKEEGLENFIIFLKKE